MTQIIRTPTDPINIEKLSPLMLTKIQQCLSIITVILVFTIVAITIAITLPIYGNNILNSLIATSPLLLLAIIVSIICAKNIARPHPTTLIIECLLLCFNATVITYVITFISSFPNLESGTTMLFLHFAVIISKQQYHIIINALLMAWLPITIFVGIYLTRIWQVLKDENRSTPTNNNQPKTVENPHE